jgi:ketosteroid isomerase-like protein
VNDFDQMGVVVDWLDACRSGDLTALLDLYADDAQLECACDDTCLWRGRDELAAYWRPKLDAFVSAGFGLEEIGPTPDGVELEYSVAGSLRIRALFGFSPNGKIFRTRCGPARQNPPDCAAC